MTQKNSFLEYLKLFRLQTGATTAVAPVIGYLVLAIQYEYDVLFFEIFALFIIGILMHIFEFVLNEYIDVNVDRRAPDLANKPLVKGTVSEIAALAVVIFSVIGTYLLTLVFFYNLWMIIILTYAFIFGAIYDVYGKRFAGSDFTLALWIFFFCLFGASAVSIHFSGLLYLVAGLGFFQILFNNAIEGGLKDSDHDAKAGAHTLANVLGVRVNVKNKIITIPVTFKVASYAIKLAHITLIVLIIYYTGVIRLSSIHDVMQLVLIILLLAILFYTMQKFLSLKKFRRDRLKRIFSVHEIATYYLAPILLLRLIGTVAVISLLFLPLFWYIGLNLVLYGKPLEPRV